MHKLARGSRTDLLELLQYLYKYLLSKLPTPCSAPPLSSIACTALLCSATLSKVMLCTGTAAQLDAAFAEVKHAADSNGKLHMM